MEYLRSWFDAHRKLIDAVEGTNVGRIYDHFIEGACFARLIARQSDIEIDRERIAAYDWNARPYWHRPDVGPQPPYIYLGGDLGLGNKSITIRISTPDGEGGAELEPVLRNCGLFTEPGRTQLLAAAALHFGLPVDALMGAQA